MRTDYSQKPRWVLEKLGWRSGSSCRMTASQVQSPEFNPQYNQKKKKSQHQWLSYEGAELGRIVVV
jgi:hypothetical protein